MEDQVARISISLKDGAFEITGSEKFVSEQIELFKEIILKKFHQEPEELPHANALKENIITAKVDPPSESVTDYSNIFEEHDGKIAILIKVPGKSKQEKTTNTALIYLFAKSISGITDVPFQEIRHACGQQACLDSVNFASTMKSIKNILISGHGKSKTAKLSVPGKEDAQKLVQHLGQI